MNRRQFLKNSVFGGVSLSLPFGLPLLSGCSRDSDSLENSAKNLPKLSLQRFKDKYILASAVTDKSGTHYLMASDLRGKILSQTQLPKRAHDCTPIPNKPGHAIVFARRPDTFAMEVDLLNGLIKQSFESSKGMHFYGHGVVSDDGQFLYTSENDYHNNQGLIVVRETNSFKIVNQFNSGGIGPHELKMMPNNTHLVVANGGIKTHPDWPRMKLNLDTMQANLSYIDIVSGKVLESVQPPHHQQSIRHIDVDRNGQVYIGMQFQGDKQQVLPLIYRHTRGKRLRPLNASQEQWKKMRQYTASVCVNDDELRVSCPRGDIVTRWDKNSLGFIGNIDFKDAAGISADSSNFVMSNGHGHSIVSNQSKQSALLSYKNLAFDNHLSLISI